MLVPSCTCIQGNSGLLLLDIHQEQCLGVVCSIHPRAVQLWSVQDHIDNCLLKEI